MSRKSLLALLSGGAAILILTLALAACGGNKGGVDDASLGAGDSEVLNLARGGSGVGSPWSMFGKNSLRTGRSDRRGPATEQLLWKYSTPTGIGTEPAIAADGTIYVATSADSRGKGSLYAVRSSGTRRWAYSFYGHGTSPVVAGDGTVYFASYRTDGGAGMGADKLFALTSSGKLKWSYWFNGESNGWMSHIGLGKDGSVLVSRGSGYLYAINQDGTVRWMFGRKGSFYAAPAVGEDGTIYAGCWDYHLYAINPDGTLKWSYPTVGWASGPSIGADGTIYVGTAPWLPGADPTPGVLHAIYPDGTTKWTHDLPGSAWYHPAIASDGSVIVMCTKRQSTDALQNAVYAVYADGSFKWSYNQNSDWLLAPVGGPVLDSDSTVFIGYQSGTGPDDYAFISIDANGSLKWTANLNGRSAEAAAIGADGTVYIGTAESPSTGGNAGLYAFGPGLN